MWGWGRNRTLAAAATLSAIVGVGAFDESPATWVMLTVVAAGLIMHVKH